MNDNVFYHPREVDRSAQARYTTRGAIGRPDESGQVVSDQRGTAISYATGEMALTYFKRYRMEIDLSGRDYSSSSLPREYRLFSWDPTMIEAHAEAKFQAFRYEVDADVFPCFTDREGCVRLMGEISKKERFLPDATWLLLYVGAGPHKEEYCGTVQGLQEPVGYGAIQNLGITPHHRGLGLGTQLMHAALAGFQGVGLERACLEVTARNKAAVQLYQHMGFRRTRTLYKAVEPVCI